MNRKHLAVIIVALLAVLFLQGVLEIRKRLVAIQNQVAEAQAASAGKEMLLNTERAAMRNIESESAAMLAYLDAWSPPLSKVNTPESGELTVSGRVKEADLVTLAQRFEVAANPGNDAIPKLVRAHLTFEDDYARTLNWLGKIEQNLPSSRVTDLRIARGESDNDVRLTLVLDVPLLAAEAPSP